MEELGCSSKISMDILSFSIGHAVGSNNCQPEVVYEQTEYVEIPVKEYVYTEGSSPLTVFFIVILAIMTGILIGKFKDNSC